MANQNIRAQVSKNIRILQGIILLGWGFFLVDKIESGEIQYYVHQRYLYLVFLSAVAFAILGLATLMDALQGAKPLDWASSDRPLNPGPDRSRPLLGSLIIAIPMLLGLVIPARPLEPTARIRLGMDATAGRFVPAWVNSLSYSLSPSVSRGQDVEEVGFLYNELCLYSLAVAPVPAPESRILPRDFPR